MMSTLHKKHSGNVDGTNEMGYTCVMWAAVYGKEEHLILLLESGASPRHPTCPRLHQRAACVVVSPLLAPQLPIATLSE